MHNCKAIILVGFINTMKWLLHLYLNIIIGGGNRREHHEVNSLHCPMKRQICRQKVNEQNNGKEVKKILEIKESRRMTPKDV